MVSNKYIHKESIGDLVKCDKSLDKIRPRLFEMYEKDYIRGYSINVMANKTYAKGIGDYLFDDEDLHIYEEETNNTYPYLYVLITPKDNFDSEKEAISLGLKKMNNF